MPSKTLLTACLLGLLPIFGHAQSDSYTLQRILQLYTESYGGFRDADALASLSVEGTIEQDGQSYDFLMHKKRPYSLRYRLSNQSNNITTGYNGSSGWMRVETNGVVTIETLDSPQMPALRKMARFESPLFRHIEKRENSIKLLEHTMLEGRKIYVIEVRERGSEVSLYYIDVVTAELLRLDELNEAGDLRQQTLYRDYREVGGFPFAHEIECRIDEKTVSLAKVNSIDVNPGLLSFYFKQPNY